MRDGTMRARLAEDSAVTMVSSSHARAVALGDAPGARAHFLIGPLRECVFRTSLTTGEGFRAVHALRLSNSADIGALAAAIRAARRCRPFRAGAREYSDVARCRCRCVFFHG